MYLIIGDNMKIWKDRKKYYIDGDIEPSKKKKYFFTKSLKKQTLVMIFSVLVVFLAMSGTSYAIFSSINQSEDYNGVKVGNLQITYNDESGAVSLANAFPMSDEDGLKSQAYSFSIQNTGSLATSYSVKLLDDQAVIDGEEKSDSEMVNKLLNKNDIKVSVNGEAPVILENLSVNDYEILNGKLQPGETKKVEVRIWIKSDASNDIFYKNSDGSLSGKYYFGKITVEGENTKTYEKDNMLLWLDGKNKTGYTLPYRYKQVEYLESTGTQYIDTETSLKNNIQFNVTYSFSESTNAWRRLFGYGTFSGIDTYSYCYKTNTKIAPRVSTGDGSEIILSNYTPGKYTMVLNTSGQISVTGDGNYNESRTIPAWKPGQGGSRVYLFNFGGTNLIDYAIAKVYSFSIIDMENDNSILDFVPCLDNNNKPCMYDTVSKTTFYNQGTGEFSYGSIVNDTDTTKWHDLSEHNDYDMSNFSNYSWNNNSLKINGNDLTDIGLKYNVNSLDTYTVSTSFKLSSNSGSVNLIDNNDINIYLSGNKLMYGNTDSGLTLDNNKLYTVTLVKKNKYTMKTDGTKETNTVLEMYVNGEFSKDVSNANKVDVTGANINIDIYNYMVYSKALSVNQENNNYKITLERYGQ